MLWEGYHWGAPLNFLKSAQCLQARQLPGRLGSKRGGCEWLRIETAQMIRRMKGKAHCPCRMAKMSRNLRCSTTIDFMTHLLGSSSWSHDTTPDPGEAASSCMISHWNMHTSATLNYACLILPWQTYTEGNCKRSAADCRFVQVQA